RLCDEAKAGQILVSQRVAGSLEPRVEVVALGSLDLRGFHHAVPAYNLLGWRDGSRGGANIV
ncbi:MAG TPA: hypothetical protein VK281_21580, partial [Xanthobacteraceae bacterium]|nr:hypothetical protein [Xanthobacteraceae bacterium]